MGNIRQLNLRSDVGGAVVLGLTRVRRVVDICIDKPVKYQSNRAFPEPTP